jgi:hypothetical protein
MALLRKGFTIGPFKDVIVCVFHSSFHLRGKSTCQKCRGSQYIHLWEVLASGCLQSERLSATSTACRATVAVTHNLRAAAKQAARIVWLCSKNLSLGKPSQSDAPNVMCTD